MANKDLFDINKLQYLYIRDLTFNYSIPQDIPSVLRREEGIHFQLDIEKNISIKDKLIILIFTIHLRSVDADNREISGIYSTEHLFKVENIQDLISRKGDTFEVDLLLDNALTGIAYATVRGLLHQKFAGTWFSNFVLPITKPAEMNKDIVD